MRIGRGTVKITRIRMECDDGSKCTPEQLKPGRKRTIPYTRCRTVLRRITIARVQSRREDRAATARGPSPQPFT